MNPRIPESWDRIFMAMALDASWRSKNPGDRFGAVVVSARHEVISTGFNGPPAGIDDSQLPWDPPESKLWHLHAEDNALNFAERSRGWVGLQDCTLYITGRPCHPCTLRIVRARIRNVVYGTQLGSMSTDYDWERATMCLRLGGVALTVLD